MLKVIEMFGGIGAFRKALINLKVPFEVVDYIEIDKKLVRLIIYFMSQKK